MIQDIYPHKLDNHYDIKCRTRYGQYRFVFYGRRSFTGSVNIREYDNYLFSPAVRDFPSDTTDIDEFL